MINNLPEINFCDTDITTIEQQVITTYEGITGRKLAPGDPERLFLEGLCAIISQQRTIIDQAGKMNLLAYAINDYLDHLGVFSETPRLDSDAAQTTMQFNISEALAFVVTIDSGTRVTPNNELFFATTETVEIDIGETSVTVTAECLTAGDAGNGFLAGQINKLVDPVDYITSVTNTTTSSGGADEEEDNPYRERINIAPESFSVAGPDGAYEYWAKTASQSIIDVSVTSSSPGQVDIYPLLTDGEIPDQTILDAVSAICSPKTVRPLTDYVVVSAPTVVNYDLTLTYYISSDNTLQAVEIQDAVDQAVDDYILWQKSKLGRDINPDELIYRLKSAGARRVELIAPVYATIDDNEVAVADAVIVTYGGLEDE